ncbi:MAG TPA: hypothetical protein VF786_03690 [Terriglobales bacterium]
MSGRTGDKSRFNRLRKQKIERRKKVAERKLAATAKPEKAQA